MQFSQRIGKTPVRQAIQIDSIDRPLENRLWNNILDNFFELIDNNSSYSSESKRGQVCLHLWTEFFNNRSDEIPQYRSGTVITSSVIDKVKEWYLSNEWYKKYDLIEFLAELSPRINLHKFIDHCNFSLKKEMAGYRIIDYKIVPITTEEEIIEIEEALTNSSKWVPVNTHLSTAIEYLSNRVTPDYRNSIKEAISAVESLCVIITDDKSATLGKALGIIEKRYRIHNALKSAFSALYGYTSDSGGIRHSLLEDDIEVTFEDAKFMLVSCSAFINYLKIKVENN